jgi:hypothetical protein
VRATETGVWILAAIAAVGFTLAAFLGFDVSELVILALFSVVTLVLGQMVASDRDRSWLPALLLAGFLVKMIGSGLRYFVYVYIYLGQGDAGRYHGIGTGLADVWRSLQVPSLEGSRGSGTRVLEMITGLLYTPFEPGLLGGFLIFAMLGFLGQVLFYAAFRRALPDGRLKLYAVLVFFLPGLAFWPASIGKEAVMMLLLGLTAYGAVRLFQQYHIKWIVVLAIGVLGSAAIRPHMSALTVGALVGAMLLARAPHGGFARMRRWALIAVAGVGLFLAITLSADHFGLDTADLELEPFLDELARRTGQGGSAVEGEPVQSIGDIPQAVLRVMFRPLIYEGFSPLALASGIEGTAMLGLILWKLPAMVRNGGLLRRRPYLLYSLLFVIGFVVIFSPVLNLGILARQRTQMLPMLLALVVGLGWAPTEEEDEPAPETTVPARVT